MLYVLLFDRFGSDPDEPQAEQLLEADCLHDAIRAALEAPVDAEPGTDYEIADPQTGYILAFVDPERQWTSVTTRGRAHG